MDSHAFKIKAGCYYNKIILKNPQPTNKNKNRVNNLLSKWNIVGKKRHDMFKGFPCPHSLSVLLAALFLQACPYHCQFSASALVKLCRNSLAFAASCNPSGLPPLILSCVCQAQSFTPLFKLSTQFLRGTMKCRKKWKKIIILSVTQGLDINPVSLVTSFFCKEELARRHGTVPVEDKGY